MPAHGAWPRPHPRQSPPEHDALCLPAEEIFEDYKGARKFGNLFSLDVGPNYAGQLREIAVKTLRGVGGMSRNAEEK